MNILHFVLKRAVATKVYTEGESLLAMYDPHNNEIEIVSMSGERIDSVPTQDDIVALALAQDESMLLFLNKEGWVRALELNERGATRSFNFNQHYCLRQPTASCLTLSSSKEFLAVGYSNGLQLYQIRSDKSPRALQRFEFTSPVTSIRFVSDLCLRVITENSVIFLEDNDSD